VIRSNLARARCIRYFQSIDLEQDHHHFPARASLVSLAPQSVRQEHIIHNAALFPWKELSAFRISSCASCKKCPPCFSYMIHPFTANAAGIKILRSLPGRTNAEKVGFERQRKEAGCSPLFKSSTTRGAPMLSAFRITSCTSCKQFPPCFPSMIYPFTVSCGACPGGGPTPSQGGVRKHERFIERRRLHRWLLLALPRSGV
jgi:hypothetical protein